VRGGCTRADWIDRALVTVNVTGQWHGTTLAKSSGAAARSQGDRRHPIEGLSRIPPREWLTIEGTIAGDVFAFTERNAPGRAGDGHR
jgi:hypothetical protein